MKDPASGTDHEFSAGGRIKRQLNCRGRIEGFVANRIPSFMFGRVDVVTLF